MSPEQATGDQVLGPASDTYALACVLYEMLVGEPPYLGNTAQAVLGKIIQGVPVSASAVRKAVPPNVDAAIRKALEKLPADRFTGAQAFARALADQSFRHGDEEVLGVVAAKWNRLAKGFAASTVLLAAALAWMLFTPAPENPQLVERFAVPFLQGQEPTFLGNAGYDLSPDGTMLVYRHIVGTNQILMVRRWDDLTATQVRETDGATNPAISLDGLELAFEQAGEIKVLALAGGPVRTLTSGSVPKWGPDGFVYATADSGAVRVPATGGAVEYVSRLADGDLQHEVYDVLPDARNALLMVIQSGGPEIRGLDLNSGEMEFIVEGGGPRYLPSGHLVYGTVDGTMMAVRFDPGKMEMEGTSVAVMDDASFWALADDGKLFYTAGSGGGGSGPTLRLDWVTRSGQATPVDPDWTFQRGIDVNQGWTISPDGSTVAVREFTAEGYDIWVKQLDTGPRSRLTFDGAHERMPVWAPGGRDVTFLSDRGGNLDVWSKPADGTREPELLLDLDASLATVDWSPDGEWLLVRTSTGSLDTSERNILAWRPGVDSVPVPLFRSDYREIKPTVSPDGRWIAYASYETGRYEIYVRPFPDVSAGRWQVSIDGAEAHIGHTAGRSCSSRGQRRK